MARVLKFKPIAHGLLPFRRGGLNVRIAISRIDGAEMTAADKAFARRIVYDKHRIVVVGRGTLPPSMRGAPTAGAWQLAVAVCGKDLKEVIDQIHNVAGTWAVEATVSRSLWHALERTGNVIFCIEVPEGK